MKITDITASDVVQAYRGKPGCMCGCNGNFFYNPRHLDKLSKALGYEINKDDEDIDEKTLTRILNKMKKHADDVEMNNSHAYLEVGSRCYAIYFVNWC